MDSAVDFHTLRDLLAWHIELGADEALGDAPLSRYDLPAEQPRPTWAQAPAAPVLPPKGPAVLAPAAPIDTVAEAERLAAEATSLGALEAAMASYPHCDLQKGARSLVFADGQPGAETMVICEPPRREEDRAGQPFVGEAALLLDNMFAAIGRARQGETPAESLYIAPVFPWRAPENRTLSEAELQMMLPFLRRHITLANPRVLVVMGETAWRAVGGDSSLTEARGRWRQIFGRPALPMFAPAQLIRFPAFKREAWADLLALKAHLSKG